MRHDKAEVDVATLTERMHDEVVTANGHFVGSCHATKIAEEIAVVNTQVVD